MCPIEVLLLNVRDLRPSVEPGRDLKSARYIDDMSFRESAQTLSSDTATHIKPPNDG